MANKLKYDVVLGTKIGTGKDGKAVYKNTKVGAVIHLADQDRFILKLDIPIAVPMEGIILNLWAPTPKKETAH